MYKLMRKNEPNEKEVDSKSSVNSESSGSPSEASSEKSTSKNYQTSLADFNSSRAGIKILYESGQYALATSKNTGLNQLSKALKKGESFPKDVIDSLSEVLNYQLVSALKINDIKQAEKLISKVIKYLKDNQDLLEFYKHLELPLPEDINFKTQEFIQKSIINKFVFLAKNMSSKLIEEGRGLVEDNSETTVVQQKVEEISKFIENLSVMAEVQQQVVQKIYPSFCSLSQEFASYLKEKGDYREAQQLYEKALDCSTTNEEKIKIYIESAKNHGLLHTKFREIDDKHYAKGAFIEAIKLDYPINNAIDNDNLSEQDLINLGSACFELGKTEEGINICNQLREIEDNREDNSSDKVSTAVVAGLFYQCGNALMSAGNFQEALNYWNKSLHKDFVEVRASDVILTQLKPNISNYDDIAKGSIINLIESNKEALGRFNKKIDQTDIESFYIVLLRDLKEYTKVGEEIWKIASDLCHTSTVLKALKSTNGEESLQERLQKSGDLKLANKMASLPDILERSKLYEYASGYKSCYLQNVQKTFETKPIHEIRKGVVLEFGEEVADIIIKRLTSSWPVPEENVEANGLASDQSAIIGETSEAIVN